MTDLKWPLAAERAAGILTCDLLASGKYNLFMQGSGEPLFPELMARLVPRGWYYQEQLSYCRLYQGELGRSFEASNQRVSPSQVEAGAHELERELAGSAGAGKAWIHHRAVASLLLPALANIARRSAEAQTVANQAALACALERHRLAQRHVGVEELRVEDFFGFGVAGCGRARGAGLGDGAEGRLRGERHGLK